MQASFLREGCMLSIHARKRCHLRTCSACVQTLFSISATQDISVCMPEEPGDENGPVCIVREQICMLCSPEQLRPGKGKERHTSVSLLLVGAVCSRAVQQRCVAACSTCSYSATKWLL